jgi:hypothetical protein
MAPGQAAVDFNAIINAGTEAHNAPMPESLSSLTSRQTASVARMRLSHKKSLARIADRAPQGLELATASRALARLLLAGLALQRYDTCYVW